MLDCENLSEISVETKDKTIVEYFANSIPRVEEFIEYESHTYRVYSVIHCIVKNGDKVRGAYAKVMVQLMK